MVCGRTGVLAEELGRKCHLEVQLKSLKLIGFEGQVRWTAD